MKYVLEITPQDCGKLFSEYGKVTTSTSILREFPDLVSLIVFTGGSDVYPKLYGEKTLSCTHYDERRDVYESEVFELAERYKIPKVGICRGSQFLCVKAGGKLIQDVTGHTKTHELQTDDGRIIPCNSSHHQMQLPPKDAKVLAWSAQRLSKHYLNGNGENVAVDREYEVVYYPNIKAIGVQPHPEWLNDQHPLALYTKEIVRKYLFSEEK